MRATQDITDFTWVDRSQDPDFYRRFLDLGNAVPGIQTSKPIILEGLQLRPGQHVIDVGCGTGADVIVLAERVGPTGKVVGVDISEAMLEEARRRLPPQLPVEFLLADACQLPFESGTFDSARTERLLMHVFNAQLALSEIIRVVRPGGHVSVFDFDWETFIIDHPDRDVTRAITRSFCDTMKTGWIGRQLPRLFSEAGMLDIRVTSHMVLIEFEFLEVLLSGHLERLKRSGGLSAKSLTAWWRALKERERGGHFFAGFNSFIVAGCKPDLTLGDPP